MSVSLPRAIRPGQSQRTDSALTSESRRTTSPLSRCTSGAAAIVMRTWSRDNLQLRVVRQQIIKISVGLWRDGNFHPPAFAKKPLRRYVRGALADAASVIVSTDHHHAR